MTVPVGPLFFPLPTYMGFKVKQWSELYGELEAKTNEALVEDQQ